jgi:hypothetical protein
MDSIWCAVRGMIVMFIFIPSFVDDLVQKGEPGWHSRCSDWLQAGQSRGRSSDPGKGRNFHFSVAFRPSLGSTQPPIQWVPGVKPTTHLRLVPKSVDLYIRSSSRLHGVVLNYWRTATTLPLLVQFNIKHLHLDTLMQSLRPQYDVRGGSLAIKPKIKQFINVLFLFS